MPELSPAAQAVADAAEILVHKGFSGRQVAAAALRAAVQETGKQKTLKTLGVTMAQSPAYCLVSDLLAIADELEAQ